ncbi:MAG: hypothetical protein AAGH40_02725 [Verrucomicrobiota bacterium]
MKIESRYATWEYKHNSKKIRLDRRFEFDTSEESERFAEQVGSAISFPNLSVYVDPVIGTSQATVTIECNDDSISLTNAYHLFESFEGLHDTHRIENMIS